MSHPSDAAASRDPPGFGRPMGAPSPVLLPNEVTGALVHFGFDAGEKGAPTT